MATPFFLDMDRVMRTHRSLIEAYGGVDGVRDAGLLHSAVAMPQASFGGQYLHADLFEMAAAYLYPGIRFRALAARNRVNRPATLRDLGCWLSNVVKSASQPGSNQCDDILHRTGSRTGERYSEVFWSRPRKVAFNEAARW